MHVIGEWFRRVWYLLHRRRLDAALRAEMEVHRLEMGTPGRFGNPLRLREEAQDVWGWGWLDDLVRDVRFAARALRRSPGFTLGAVTSLALGLALTASAIAVANAYLIQSLPYPAAERLYHVMYAPPGPWEPAGLSRLDWALADDVVEFPITSSGDTFYLSDGGFAGTARGLRVAPGFIGGLGVRAAVGRTLNDGDFNQSPEPAALISHALWRDRFGASTDAIGRVLRTDNERGDRETFRIVGVLPDGFYAGRDSSQRVDVMVPLTVPVRTYMVRLREGVPPTLAERRITDAARAVATDLPANWTGVRLESVRERYAGELRPVLVGMTAASVLVLVIVCANVAVLMVLRTARRQKEMAVRIALGSGRWPIARMLGAEAVLLCGTAMTAGLALTSLALGALAPVIETQLGRPAPRGTAAIALDPTVVLASGLLGLTIALSLSFLPLLLPWRGRIFDVLRRSGTTTTDGRSMRRLRSLMLAFEVAATLVLLVGCGLMIRSVTGMLRTDLGFESNGLARSRVVLRAADYPEPADFARFYGPFTTQVAATLAGPVVFSSWPPFAELPEQMVEIDQQAGHLLNAGTINVGAGYFATLGITLRNGRDFTADDAMASAPAAVISETLSQRLWPARSALGRQLRLVQVTAGGPSPPGPWRTVVGVAADVRQSYGDANLQDVYTPWTPTGRFASFYVRTDTPPEALLTAMRSTAAGIDARAVIDPPRLVATENRELSGTRFLTSMLTAFAILAALIALVGIYGVTAYAVQQREREMAIRLALGAARGAVVRLFVRENARVLAVGVIAGLVGAAAMARLIRHQIRAVETFDLPTLVAMSALLAGAGLAATWWPARRASRTNPTATLKEG